jgi:hypothetical protein
MKIAVLFDGAGLARLGLEQSGHTCVGVELDPHKHHLSAFVGKGDCRLADVRSFDLTSFDAVWASPPCQQRSQARTQGAPRSIYADDLVDWALALDTNVLWVENVVTSGEQFGVLYNAAQFHEPPPADQEPCNRRTLPSARSSSTLHQSTQGSLPCRYRNGVSWVRKRSQEGFPLLRASSNARGVRLSPRLHHSERVGYASGLVHWISGSLAKPAIRGHWKRCPCLYGAGVRGGL